jgi:hypothetical protein
MLLYSTLAFSIIDVFGFQVYVSVCWGSFKLGSSHRWATYQVLYHLGDEKDGENDLAFLSPGTASCLALVRGSLLQDYKWGICLTKHKITRISKLQPVDLLGLT